MRCCELFCCKTYFFSCMKLRVMASSNIFFYERTPELAEHDYKSLSGQPRLFTGLGCFWASSDSVS